MGVVHGWIGVPVVPAIVLLIAVGVIGKPTLLVLGVVMMIQRVKPVMRRHW